MTTTRPKIVAEKPVMENGVLLQKIESALANPDEARTIVVSLLPVLQHGPIKAAPALKPGTEKRNNAFQIQYFCCCKEVIGKKGKLEPCSQPAEYVSEHNACYCPGHVTLAIREYLSHKDVFHYRPLVDWNGHNWSDPDDIPEVNRIPKPKPIE